MPHTAETVRQRIAAGADTAAGARALQRRALDTAAHRAGCTAALYPDGTVVILAARAEYTLAVPDYPAALHVLAELAAELAAETAELAPVPTIVGTAPPESRPL